MTKGIFRKNMKEMYKKFRRFASRWEIKNIREGITLSKIFINIKNNSFIIIFVFVFGPYIIT